MAVEPLDSAEDPHQAEGGGREKAVELHEQEENDREGVGSQCGQKEIRDRSRRDGET